MRKNALASYSSVYQLSYRSRSVNLWEIEIQNLALQIGLDNWHKPAFSIYSKDLNKRVGANKRLLFDILLNPIRLLAPYIIKRSKK